MPWAELHAARNFILMAARKMNDEADKVFEEILWFVYNMFTFL